MWTMMPWLYELQRRGGQGIIYASLIIAAVPTFVVFALCQNVIMRGIAVPSQLSVCGFGNFELGATNEPPFTTVSVEGAEIGRTAAGFLLRRLSGAPAREDDRVHVAFRIVERAST